MGLSVYLVSPEPETIKCYNCGNDYTEDIEYYESNITHNLSTMADKAGIGDALWNPEDIPIKTAKEIIPILEKGLQDLKDRPDYFKEFNAKNGWGLYEHFVPFVEKYLNACKMYPDAIIRTCK